MAGAGNDLMLADEGDDLIEAGLGDDIIDGGDGEDEINGGEGFDTVVFTGSNIGVRADLESRVGQGGVAQGDEYTSLKRLKAHALAIPWAAMLLQTRLAALAAMICSKGAAGRYAAGRRGR